MTNDDTPHQIIAANKARVRLLAERAAHDPVKVLRAARVVAAALDAGTLTLEDLAEHRQRVEAGR